MGGEPLSGASLSSLSAEPTLSLTRRPIRLLAAHLIGEIIPVILATSKQSGNDAVTASRSCRFLVARQEASFLVLQGPSALHPDITPHIEVFRLTMIRPAGTGQARGENIFGRVLADTSLLRREVGIQHLYARLSGAFVIAFGRH